MSEKSTILLRKDTIRALQHNKDHPRQSYEELIRKMMKVYMSHKNQYDEFLHRIQQDKMTELWDNQEDEEWENA